MDLSFDWSDIGWIESKRGRLAEAEALYHRMLELRESLWRDHRQPGQSRRRPPVDRARCHHGGGPDAAPSPAE